MLKNAPPGTELIISGISILISIVLIFGMMYSWFILQSDMITMLFAGFIMFIMIMISVYYLRRDKGEDEDDDESDNSGISLDPDEPLDN